MQFETIIAGFGGQGVLFNGQSNGIYSHDQRS